LHSSIIMVFTGWCNEIGLQEKRSVGITDPIWLHLRTVAIERRRAEEALRERTRIEDAEQQRAKRDLREKQVELETTKTQARIASAQSVATTRLETDQTRRRQRLAEQEMATARKNLKLYFAYYRYAQKLSKAANNTSSAKLNKVIEELLLNTAVRRRIPGKWPDMAFMETPTNLEPVHIYKKPKDAQVVASTNFARVLFNGSRPQDMRSTEAVPHTRLQQLLGQRLPGYNHVAPHYPAADLLRHAHHVVDAAFLRGVQLNSTSKATCGHRSSQQYTLWRRQRGKQLHFAFTSPFCWQSDVFGEASKNISCQKTKFSLWPLC